MGKEIKELSLALDSPGPSKQTKRGNAQKAERKLGKLKGNSAY